MFICFDRIHERDRRMDRKRENARRHTRGRHTPRVCIASRGNKDVTTQGVLFGGGLTSYLPSRLNPISAVGELLVRYMHCRYGHLSRALIAYASCPTYSASTTNSSRCVNSALLSDAAASSSRTSSRYCSHRTRC